MCGRFTLRTPLSVLMEQFAVEMDTLDHNVAYRPRYNIAPTQRVMIVRQDQATGNRELATVHWGLIPSWAKDAAIGNSLINARAETIATKPSFRSAFKRRRCLVLADGFYEWKKAGKAKLPSLFQFADQRAFAFAGLWETWRSTDATEAMESCSIVTTEANDLSRPIHDRMPVILSPDDYAPWLETENSELERLQGMLRPWAGEAMVALAVSTHVNSARNDDPECIRPRGA